MFKYKNIIFEGIEKKIEDGFNDWTNICQHCVDKYNVDQDKLDDGASGYCMVLGCENEADYYIDFEDGEVKEWQE